MWILCSFQEDLWRGSGGGGLKGRVKILSY